MRAKAVIVLPHLVQEVLAPLGRLNVEGARVEAVGVLGRSRAKARARARVSSTFMVLATGAEAERDGGAGWREDARCILASGAVLGGVVHLVGVGVGVRVRVRVGVRVRVEVRVRVRLRVRARLRVTADHDP